MDEEPAYLVGLVGESHSNADGSSRQAELKRCIVGEPVGFSREPHNPHDPLALLVVSRRGVGLGYIPTRHSWIAEAMDDGELVAGIVNSVTGGTRDKPTRGCVIRVRVGPLAPLVPIGPDGESMSFVELARLREASPPTANPPRRKAADAPKRNWLAWVVLIFLALLIFVGTQARGK